MESEGKSNLLPPPPPSTTCSNLHPRVVAISATTNKFEINSKSQAMANLRQASFHGKSFGDFSPRLEKKIMKTYSLRNPKLRKQVTCIGESFHDIKQTFSLRAPSHGGLRVVVVFVSTGEQHVVDLPTNGTAGDVRATLQLHSLRRLYFSGIELEDDHVLKDCGVVTQSTLHLVDGTAPDGDPPFRMKKDDNPVPDAQSHVEGKFSKLLPLKDRGEMFREKLSQLPLDNSLHSCGCIRRTLSVYFDACLHPRVPESSKLWWWPTFKHFKDLKKGCRVQVLDIKAGAVSWLDAQVVMHASTEEDLDSHEEDEEWATAGESVGRCIVRLLAGEQKGQEAVVTSLRYIRGAPRAGVYKGMLGIDGLMFMSIYH